MQALRTAMGLSTAAERRAQNLQSVKDKAAALAQPKLSPELSQPYPAVVDADIVRSPSLEAATARRNAVSSNSGIVSLCVSVEIARVAGFAVAC